MNRPKSSKKIRLNREVLKNLAPEQTGKVAGGISVGTCSACVDTYCWCASRHCRPSNNPLAC